ncbi:ABC transporter ATP-binding protein [Georgenia yuyongxinii]|uniref:Spermidine/putrescine import ATP-binding protein PotA n=2 Tax=Georgenia yuyongxinii TaxID=2589797 RepID=A0A5B8CAG3_9MICO|nr:ABC transporter ATP-binding protein [Georgenia yuyongxinii]
MARQSRQERAGRLEGDLQIRDVTKTFGAHTAVDDLTVTIPEGSFFALLGPSGCGKTTTLRMVAGLEEPTAGEIWLGRQDVTRLKPYRRPINTAFQNYALFPHLDIFENIAFGLRRRGIKNVRAQVEDMLGLVELAGYGDRRPSELSGGQQQRVALARALINQPKVLLLDEPLGALDLKLRRQMQIELKRIQTEVGLTFLHVTHDQEEAMTMADTIAVMNNGRIEQMGSPAELYDRPATTFVANFLGQCNLLRATAAPAGDDVALTVEGRRWAVPAARSSAAGTDVWVGVRPEKLRLTAASAVGPGIPAGANAVEGVVTDTSYVGVSTQYLVKVPWGQELVVFEQNVGVEGPVEPGTDVVVHFDGGHGFVLDAAGDGVRGGAPAEATVGALT